MIERIFKLKANQTNVRAEVLAGLTTFAAMAYILAVNPSILSGTGMEREGLITVTALAAVIGSLLMAFMANLPIALAPGMGTNAYFAFIVVLSLGYPWQAALSLTFWNGVIFLILSLSGIRRKIIESLPQAVKVGIQCGIGLFIALIGLQSVGIVADHPVTLVTAGDLTSPAVLLTLLGVIVMLGLLVRKVPGALVLGVLMITLIGLFVPGAGEDAATVTAHPDKFVSLPAGIGQTFLQLDWLYPFRHWSTAYEVLFTLLLLDLFDSIGTIIGLVRKIADDEKKMMDRLGLGLAADALATIAGAMLGTSTTTAYIESAAGVEAGGRTGLSSVVVAGCFLIALFFTPIIAIIPAAATAPVLILVGIFMSSGFKDINYEDMPQVSAAILTAFLIPFTFSITEGIAFGLILWIGFMLASRRYREINWMTYVLAAVFLWFLFK